jgi:membrane protein DedA with SNARE-associated domain/rhodanese-related sulfurtransferase
VNLSFTATHLLSAPGSLALLSIALNVLLDQLGLPLPALPALLLAGALAAQHPRWAGQVLLLTVVTSVLANVVWFWAGRRHGMRVMRSICRISLSPDSCVSNAQSRFERWGDAALLLSKIVPGLSVMGPTLAGALSMRWSAFLSLSFASSLLWVGASMLLGGLFGAQLLPLLAASGHLGRWALLIVVGAFVLYIALRLWRRLRFQASLRMARIGAAELQSMLSSSAAPLVLDVRSAAARRLQPFAVPGALHLPSERLAQSLAGLPRDRDIVLYCTCPNEASAAWIARQLMDAGLGRVRPLLGGLDAWVAAGYPVQEIAALPLLAASAASA